MVFYSNIYFFYVQGKTKFAISTPVKRVEFFTIYIQIKISLFSSRASTMLSIVIPEYSEADL